MYTNFSKLFQLHLLTVVGDALKDYDDEMDFTFLSFIQDGNAGEEAKTHLKENGKELMYSHQSVGVWFFDYLEFLDCHSNSTTTGYSAWKPGTLLSEIKYRKGDVWGPNQMCEFQSDSMQTKHNEGK